MNKNFFKELIKAFLQMKTEEQMRDFLYGILTPKELEELSTRLQIVRKLQSGMKQQNIAKQLKVGVATVTRGSRELKMGRFKYL